LDMTSPVSELEEILLAQMNRFPPYTACFAKPHNLRDGMGAVFYTHIAVDVTRMGLHGIYDQVVPAAPPRST